MQLEIRLYNEFKKFSPGEDNIFSIACAPGDTIGHVFEALKIPVNTHAVVLLNGRRAGMDTPIEPQSRLVVFAPVSGG